jgi:hypothetical protein
MLCFCPSHVRKTYTFRLYRIVFGELYSKLSCLARQSFLLFTELPSDNFIQYLTQIELLSIVPNGNAPCFIILMSHTSRFCLSRGECWRSQIRLVCIAGRWLSFEVFVSIMTPVRDFIEPDTCGALQIKFPAFRLQVKLYI